MDAGKLRHWVVIQQPTSEQDSTGAVVDDWVTVAETWAAIEPLSAREFVASAAEQSKVVARITIRYRPGIRANMRIFHQAHNEYYNIEGVLRDKASGLEYITLPVSEGVRI